MVIPSDASSDSGTMGEAGTKLELIDDLESNTGLILAINGRAGVPTVIRFNVPGKDTDAQGGVCKPVSACSDYFGATLSLTTDWAQTTILFSDLRQEGWGMPIAMFDPKTVYAVQFKVAPNAPFEVWVDDIAFVER